MKSSPSIWHYAVSVKSTVNTSWKSDLSDKRGGWNKRGGGAKNRKSLNVEGVIKNNFWARIKFYSSKKLWEKLVSAIISGTLLMKSINVERGFFLWRVEFLKMGKHGLHVY